MEYWRKCEMKLPGKEGKPPDRGEVNWISSLFRQRQQFQRTQVHIVNVKNPSVVEVIKSKSNCFPNAFFIGQYANHGATCDMKTV